MWAFVSRVMSLLFNTLSRFVIAFLPRSSLPLISRLQLLFTATFGAHEEEICHYFHLLRFHPPWSNGPDAMILVFWTLSLKPALSLSSLPSSRGSLAPLGFLPLEWCHLHICGCCCSSRLSWLQLVTHPAWHFSWCAQCIGNINRLTADSPVVLLSQSWTSQLFMQGSDCCFLTSYRFLRRQVRWSDVPISLRAFHSFSWSTQSKALA